MDRYGVSHLLIPSRSRVHQPILARYCSGGSCSDLVRLSRLSVILRGLPTIQMKPGVFREEYIAIIVRELLRGLDYLHTEGKLHRDIKGIYYLPSLASDPL